MLGISPRTIRRIKNIDGYVPKSSTRERYADPLQKIERRVRRIVRQREPDQPDIAVLFPMKAHRSEKYAGVTYEFHVKGAFTRQITDLLVDAGSRGAYAVRFTLFRPAGSWYRGRKLKRDLYYSSPQEDAGQIQTREDAEELIAQYAATGATISDVHIVYNA